MPFEKCEFKIRLNKTKIEMQKRGIELLISTNPANINYLSGYDGYSFYVVQGLVVLLDEPEPIWIGRNMDVPGALFSTWLSGENIRGYEDDYFQSDTKHPMHFFADILKERGITNQRIGLEWGQDSFNVTSYNELQKKMPDCKFTDASFLINQVRMIKSETEINYMKIAGNITVNAMKVAIDAIGEGMRESDVAADIYQTLIRGTGEYAGDYPAIIPLLSSGEKVSAPHLSWTNRRYKRDDIVSIELSGCLHRYHTPLARTIYIGAPSQEYMDIVNVVQEGLNNMLEFIKPGITCAEVAEEWNKVLSQSSVTKESRVGYPIGIGYPPDWGEQTVSIRAGDTSILQKNMTFHVLPGLFQAEIGFVVSESIRITENGCELLTNLSNDLIVK
ncbi:M24 family metallopeptidase [Fictibacillus sp. FJAT-27399]|uniref:M24 family metallopeptidase n=1 Tax=Fictibacillus sp. FJAT-27399 TaxID=1729689 RepID=UPI000A83F6B7|nr:M24 family metallopeptidase [Fictibacillus sp. FJAT-27399]